MTAPRAEAPIAISSAEADSDYQVNQAEGALAEQALARMEALSDRLGTSVARRDGRLFISIRVI